MSAHEKTPLNIRRGSRLLKRAYIIYFLTDRLSAMLLHCFQLAVTSATSSSSQDCAGRHNNAAEHRI